MLLRADKRPYHGKGWPTRPVTAEAACWHVQHRQHPLGIMPASISSSALDVDEGDPTLLLAHNPCWANLPTRRGQHLYYRDNAGRRNQRWAAYGCRGEVRSARGYLMFHGAGVELLAAAVRQGPRGVLFPGDDLQLGLWEAAGVSLPRTLAAATDRQLRHASRAAVLLDPELVHVGQRNVMLFDHVRHWAYGAWAGAVWEIGAWHGAVQAYATSINGRFPDPLDPSEVGSTAYSISSWVASGGGPRNHGRAAQARRGRVSGLVRRGVLPSRAAGDVGKRRSGHLRADVYLRDVHICQLLDAGLKQADVAAAVGVSQSWVSRVGRRRNYA